MKFHVECSACDGTGVYVGNYEKDGASVVCNRCAGTGGIEETYTVFTERKRHEGVKTVAFRGGFFPIRPGDDWGEVTYEEFLAGKMPTPDNGYWKRLAQRYLDNEAVEMTKAGE
jgi:hypothetical protein